jgi:hypothetical protein
MKWWEKDNFRWFDDWRKNCKKVTCIGTTKGIYPVYESKRGGKENERTKTLPLS